MKKLIILTLLSINIYATDKAVEVPEEVCVALLEKIVEHGWSDTNATLNTFIIQSGTSAIPRILSHINEPLIYEDYKDMTHFKMFKLKIHKKDYTQLFSYVKYLEHTGRDEEADKIYIDTLNGLNNISNEQHMSLMFRMMNEEVILSSLKERKKHKTLSINLTNKLAMLLLFDNQYLFENLDSERKIVNSYANDFPKLKELSDMYHNKFIEAIQNNSLKEFEKSMIQKKDAFLSYTNIAKYVYAQGKLKLYTFLGLNVDETFIRKFQFQLGMYEVREYTIETIMEYQEQVKENQKFLKEIIWD